jgi:hypothetical protein
LKGEEWETVKTAQHMDKIHIRLRSILIAILMGHLASTSDNCSLFSLDSKGILTSEVPGQAIGCKDLHISQEPVLSISFYGPRME